MPADNLKYSVWMETSSTARTFRKASAFLTYIDLSKKSTKAHYQQDVSKLVLESTYASDGLCIKSFTILSFKSKAGDILDCLWGSSFGGVVWILTISCENIVFDVRYMSSFVIPALPCMALVLSECLISLMYGRLKVRLIKIY